MKIIQIITGLGIGGAEKIVSDLSGKLANNQHDVLIISLTGDKLMKTPSEVNVIEMNMTKGIVSIIKTYWGVRKIIKEFNPDVVHSHMFHANIFARFIRLTLPFKKLISTAHSNNEGGSLRMFAYRLTDSLAELSTNVSEKAVAEFIDKKASKPGRMVPIYNGVDTQKFYYSSENRTIMRTSLNVPDDARLIMTVGRLTEAKDYPNLINAFASLECKNSTYLAIIGDGELNSSLKELAVSLKVDNNIIWLGKQDNIEKWLSACDLFVLSSVWEGFGIVLAEAMACERVVIATNVGGVEEVVGDANFLVPPSRPDLLMHKIKAMLNLDNEEFMHIGMMNRHRIERKFSIDNIVMQWESIYINTKVMS
ncbi:glycosyltransferase [Citrobacter braakii]|uniref:glycosyltransferase n=1 Tax=Citrobacter TaxID=544 RepID=UPI00066B76D3|nr:MULTISPECIES: glycosyltransferase [Citrobacter]MDM3470512.1 glycosyltransferase [Citrobacter sp. Cb041]HCB1522762.1 glycosyltransferase [Citrobacter braakii]HCB1527614.1 glycosyltransferase [Citrobacter braakii]